MENIKISITGREAERQASAIIRAFYKTMSKMEDGGSHVRLETYRSKEEADGLEVPDFVVSASARMVQGRRY